MVVQDEKKIRNIPDNCFLPLRRDCHVRLRLRGDEKARGPPHQADRVRQVRLGDPLPLQPGPVQRGRTLGLDLRRDGDDDDDGGNLDFEPEGNEWAL